MPNQGIASSDAGEIAALKAVIDIFIQERLQAKLDKLGEDDGDKRGKLLDEHRRDTWIADAARRVGQIQLASHTLKPIHPDARGTSIYLRERICSENALVGTHVLTEGRADDVVGNAAALDVFKFLKMAHDGRTILSRALVNDPALLAAFSDEVGQAQTWVDAFAGIVNSKTKPATHTLAKQLYFPMHGGGYHLLAPLFPTALVHRLHEILNVDRFSAAAKEARAARKENKSWPAGYREYPNLAIQNFGGSKPQNISQLNSERGGVNYLLPSLPPIWESDPIRPPMRHKSIFEKYGAFSAVREVRELTKKLREFLVRAGEFNNIKIRDRRAELVDDIVDALFIFSIQIQSLPGGWSRSADCRLDYIEKRWLDPETTNETEVTATAVDGALADANWRDEIADRFANWLNAAIRTDRTPMGDDEYQAWKNVILKARLEIREEMVDES